jgi:hypothetical protein
MTNDAQTPTETLPDRMYNATLTGAITILAREVTERAAATDNSITEQINDINQRLWAEVGRMTRNATEANQRGQAFAADGSRRTVSIPTD